MILNKIIFRSALSKALDISEIDLTEFLDILAKLFFGKGFKDIISW